MTVSDDWDGFGQRGTGSGTTDLRRVPVPADHVLPFDERFPYQTAVYQLNLLATLAGIARAALADAVDEVRDARAQLLPRQRGPRARRPAGAGPGRRDRRRDVRRRGGHPARRGRRPGRVDHRRRRGTSGDRRPRTRRPRSSRPRRRWSSASWCSSATTRPLRHPGRVGHVAAEALDRHWRNARTVASHNPRLFKARVVGAHLVNGTPPPYVWGIGTTQREERP